MLNELSERELGVGFIYSILKLFATRHGLTDVAVVLVNESFGTQIFRLGGEAVTPGDGGTPQRVAGRVLRTGHRAGGRV
jgi:hypothetical protein